MEERERERREPVCVYEKKERKERKKDKERTKNKQRNDSEIKKKGREK